MTNDKLKYVYLFVTPESRDLLKKLAQKDGRKMIQYLDRLLRREAIKKLGISP